MKLFLDYLNKINRGCPPEGQCAGPAWVNMRAEKELLRHATAPFLLFPVQTHRKIVSLSWKHRHFPTLQLYRDKVK